MCFLRITSETKSFKGNPALERLPLYSIHEKGELRRKKTGELHKNYRVGLDVSDAEWDDFPQQVEDAIEFLSVRGDALKQLLDSFKDASACMDFPLWSRLSDEILMQSEKLPTKLVALASQFELSIELSYYQKPSFDELDK